MDQLDDLDEDPVVGGTGHQLEEQRSQRQVVLGILTRQLTDHVHRRRLYTYATQHSPPPTSIACRSHWQCASISDPICIYLLIY